MEIKDSNVATLSNFEVMTHLKNMKDRRKKSKGQLATITYETLKYLEKTPCSQQSPEDMLNCLKALEPYNLNKNERLMIVNTPPTTPLEIQLMIEESEERLTDEQVGETLQIIATHLHVKPRETEGGE